MQVSKPKYYIFVCFMSILNNKIITMARSACEPVISWTSKNLVDSFKFFKQRCKLYLLVKNISAGKQVDHILLLADEERPRRYNSWTFDSNSD